MKTLITTIVLLLVSNACNGHLSTITGILGGAHKHVHDTVHNVAGSVLGGLNVNFGAHFNSGYDHRVPPHQAEGPPDMVVVVVEEDQPHYGQHNQYGYGHNNYNNHYQPGPQYGHPQQNGNYPNNNDYNPYNNMQQRPQYPYGTPQNNYPPNQQNDRPGYHQHQSTPQTNYGNPNNNYGYNNMGQNGNNQRPTPFQPTENSFKPTENPFKSTENPFKPTSRPSTSSDYNTPTYGSIYNPNENNNADNTPKPIVNSEKDKTTKKPDDEPLFVPLHPNEYASGGDKNPSAPKRETDSQPSGNDDDFPIDIRFQDE